MPFRTICPNCQASYKLPDSMDGKKVRCAKCSKVMVASVPLDLPLADEPAEVASQPLEVALPQSSPGRVRDEDDSEADRPRKRKPQKERKQRRRTAGDSSDIRSVALYQKIILLCI